MGTPRSALSRNLIANCTACGAAATIDADVAIVVLLSQKLRPCSGQCLDGESLDVEILGIDLDGTLERVGDDLSERVLDDDRRGRRALVAVDHEHAFGGRRGIRVRGESEQSRRKSDPQLVEGPHCWVGSAAREKAFVRISALLAPLSGSPARAASCLQIALFAHSRRVSHFTRASEFSAALFDVGFAPHPLVALGKSESSQCCKRLHILSPATSTDRARCDD